MMRSVSISIAVAALSSLLVLPACSQNDDIDESGTYTIEVAAVKGSSEASPTTRALALEEDFLSAPWKDGETVSVFKLNPSAQSAAEASQEVGTLTAQSSNGYTTNLVGKLTGTFKPGDRLLFFYQHGFKFDYRGQKGTLEDIASNYDYAIADHEVSAVSSSTITVSTALVFSSLQSIFKFNLKDPDGAPLKASKLVIRSFTAGANGSEQDFLVQFYDPTQMGIIGLQTGPIEVDLSTTPSSVIFVALAGFGQHGPLSPLEAKPITMTATVGEDTYTYTKDSFSFDINKYYVYDVKMTKQE